MTIAADPRTTPAPAPARMTPSNAYIDEILSRIESATPHEPEFIQAAIEILPSLAPVIERHAKYRAHRILERLIEPERTIMFRVTWLDDAEQIHVNRGYRIQFNSAIGPYKGGLRFHPSVNLSVLKFLGFEQTFKNSLTGQAIGGAKGGSDFNPKGRSELEIMRFCQAFATELYRYIGPNTDVPAGDIGVGTREIGYLYGMHRKLTNEFTGAFTGKGIGWGGSKIRTEATGYGCVYFAANMLATRNDTLVGKRCLVSGSGNVAQYTVEKLNHLGATVLTMSDSDGFIFDPNGIDQEKLEWVKDLKNERRGRIREYAEKFRKSRYTDTSKHGESNPLWQIEADCAFPCATQNEITGVDAKHLLENGVMLVCEGANMPTDVDGQDHFREAGILFGPAKAANAGGVAVSALEMAQNSQRAEWSRDEVDHRLREIMKAIHDNCIAAINEYAPSGNYQDGANIAGFIKIADAMIDQGVA